MLDKLKNLTTGEKLFALAAVSIGGYLLYSYYTEGTASASEGDVSKLPAGAPPPSAPAQIPAYTGPTTSGGPLAYVVVTQVDPLNIRSAPSLDALVVGLFDKGGSVKATGRLAKGSGMTWAEVITPEGQKAWSSTTYLKAV